MVQNFASNLADALPGGIGLAQEMGRQRQTRAARKAGEVMARMQSFDPFQGADDPTQQGLPQPGQKTLTNPNQGFDGKEFSKLSDEYFKAIGDIGDIRDYAAAREVYGQFRMEKINNSIDSALTAYDQGDMAGATKSLRGASAYMSPDITPEINIDPQSGAFVVANYKDGKPHSGYALTRDQLMDIRGRNTDFNSWATRDQQKIQHKEEMGLKYAQFAASQRTANARTALMASAADAKAVKAAADLTGVQLSNQLKELDITKKTATLDTGIAADIATNRATQATGIATEAAAPSVGKAATAKADEEARVADEAAHTEFMKTVGEKTEELFQYPISDSTPAPAGGGPAAPGSAIPTDGSADTGNVSLESQYASMGAGITNTKGQGKTALDPLMYDTSPNGTSRLRPEVKDLTSRLIQDVWDYNGGKEGDLVPEQVSSVVGGAIGTNQVSKLVPGEDQEGNPKAYLTDGVSKFEVSPDSYRLLYAYQQHFQAEYAKARGEEPAPSDTPPVAVGNSTPDMPTMPAQPTQMPGGGGPSTNTDVNGPVVQTQADQSMGVQGVPVPPGLAPPPGAPSGSSGVIDDTAAPAPGNPNIPLPRQNAPTIQRVPGLAQAVQAWDSVGRDTHSPQMQRILDIMGKLPDDVKQKVAQEIQQTGQ